MAHLVTGYAGYEHIKSADDRAYNAAFFGSGQYVMETGNQFEGSIIDNNTVRILDGDLLMYGGHVRIEPNVHEDLTIETGTAGANRVDLICMTYEKNETDGTEKAFLQVVKGTPSTSAASLPAYTNGNILEGAVMNQMPLYKVTIQGVALTSIEPMFEVIPTYKALAERYAAEFQTACETHLGALNILDTLEEVDANTKGNQLAGALALKEMHAKHREDLEVAGTVRYNPLTDMLELKSNGEWVEWKTAGLKELIPLIPLMTSNSQDGYSLVNVNGIEGVNSGEKYYLYWAFDHDDEGESRCNVNLKGDVPLEIVINMPYAKCAKRLYANFQESRTSSITLYGSNDGVQYDELVTVNTTGTSKKYTIDFNNTKAYKHYKFCMPRAPFVTEGAYIFTAQTIQLYGIE